MTLSSTATTIGKSVKIRGEIVSAEDLVLDGDFEGTLQVTGAVLTLGPASRVRADVHAQDLVLQGRLDGNIHASGRVELRSGAMVQGDIFSGSLTIEPNVAFRGKVEPMASQPVQAPAPMPVAERPMSMPVRTAPVPHSPLHSFGLGQAGVRTTVVPTQQPNYGGSPFSPAGPVSSGAHRIPGQYPTGLAAAAAAANRQPASPSGENETQPAPTLVFNERKA